jgi:hypothetical protein
MSENPVPLVCIGAIIIDFLVFIFTYDDQYKKESEYSTLSAICTIGVPIVLLFIFMLTIFVTAKNGSIRPLIRNILILSMTITHILCSISFGYHCKYVGCFYFETPLYVYILIFFFAFGCGMLPVYCLSIGYLCDMQSINHTSDQIQIQTIT